MKFDTSHLLYPSHLLSSAVQTNGYSIDITGRVRKTIQVAANSSAVKINVADLEYGIYIYKYMVNNTTTDTGKLIIK